jgi:hypothetical protein
MMTFQQWLTGTITCTVIFLAIGCFLLVLWRLSKRDEEDRRLREEGPNYEQSETSKFVGKCH